MGALAREAEIKHGPSGGPPPWIDEAIQKKIAWRDGDVVVSVPAKSGTTWAMNIVHQLRSGGDPSFTDIYAEVPWLEIVPRPDTDLDDLISAFDAMPRESRRALKSHAAPPTLPFQSSDAGPGRAIPGGGPQSRRGGRVVPPVHLGPLRRMVRPLAVRQERDRRARFRDLHRWVREPCTGTEDLRIPGLMVAVTQRTERHALHYSDLKREPEGSIRQIAEFLDFDVPEPSWPAILAYTSFTWMKAHEDKFELRSIADIPILEPGAMVRKGRTGASAEDGITPRISDAIAEIGHTILTDRQAFDWCYRGGTTHT